ncbi:MAG: TIGR00730 family Rossman fold protein [Planctomycetes bacterium]|nr:TIGR00730 family Rossman fold protein [Planctomycetota bacterium]
MRITVYCASSQRAPQSYRDAAFELGALLARRGVQVVFGGGAIGSMGALADGVHAVGAHPIGVMPHFMRELEWAHPQVQTFEWTHTMADRKARLLAGTDALVALPGGCGTFEELMEAITLKRLGLYLNPIIIVNQDGFYDPLLALFERSVQDRFMDPRHLTMYSVVSSVDEVMDAIENAPAWSEENRHFSTQKDEA